MENEDVPQMVIDLSGTWLVNFAIPTINAEGSRIITLIGDYDPDFLMDDICRNIHDSLDENTKKVIDEGGHKFVVRNMVKLGFPRRKDKADND